MNEELCSKAENNPNKLKRWGIAQKSEKEYWENYNEKTIFKESSGRNPKRAEEMMKKWEKWKNIAKSTKILQVGCGPEDVINYFKKGKFSSVDPLADFYKEKFKLIDYKKSGLVKAPGENLPFKDNSFDVVILTNVLDHVCSPEKTLSEINRVLKEDGLFHFEVFVYQKNFLRLSKIFSVFKKIFKKQIYNINHPYMFQKKDTKHLLNKNFSILFEDFGPSALDGIENMQDMKYKKKASKRLSVKLPAYFGLYGIINYTAICRKKSKL